MRTRADHEIGPCIDDRVRERERVATILTEEHPVPGDDMLVRDAFGAGVHRHDDDVGARFARATSRLAAPMSVRLCAHGYGANPSSATRMPRTV